MNSSIKRIYLGALSNRHQPWIITQHFNLIELSHSPDTGLCWYEAYLLRPGYVDFLHSKAFIPASYHDYQT